MNKLSGKVSRVYERGMAWFARNAGVMFPLCIVLAGVSGGTLVWFLEDDPTQGLVPSFAYVIGFFGVLMELLAFIRQGRDSFGARPSLLILAFIYERLALVLLLVAILLLRLERTYGWIPLDIGVPFLYGMVYASCTAFFMVGWALFYGASRGWLPKEVDPYPLGGLARWVASRHLEEAVDGDLEKDKPD